MARCRVQAQLGEELDFKVIEFNKDSKRIILSHSRIYEDARQDVRKPSAPAKKGNAKKEATPTIHNKAASTTLGDLDALAALKATMEKNK